MQRVVRRGATKRCNEIALSNPNAHLSFPCRPRCEKKIVAIIRPFQIEKSSGLQPTPASRGWAGALAAGIVRENPGTQTSLHGILAVNCQFKSEVGYTLD
jgi:hypothetical protein